MNKVKFFVEDYAFGVCSYLGDKLGIASSYIRLFFIYFTFISAPSPLIIYLILAFWLNIKKYILQGRKFFSE